MKRQNIFLAFILSPILQEFYKANKVLGLKGVGKTACKTCNVHVIKSFTYSLQKQGKDERLTKR